MIAKEDQLWRIIYSKYCPSSQFINSMKKLNDKNKIAFDFSLMYMKKTKSFVLNKYGSKHPKCCICEETFRISYNLGGIMKKNKYHCQEHINKSKTLLQKIVFITSF
jgi:hypothetical protein